MTVSSSFISRSLAKVGFLERIQAQPKSHHFLMELPPNSPIDGNDFDLGNLQDDGVEHMGCILNEKEDNLLRRPCSFESACETGSPLALKLWKMELMVEAARRRRRRGRR